MPIKSKVFEFYNPWSNKNTHTNQPSITMPQMVNGKMPPRVLELYSDRTEAAGFYALGPFQHTVTYQIGGGFIGECVMQASTSPNPLTIDWVDLETTRVKFIGSETTGGAGLGGGFTGAVSRPTKTVSCQSIGDYSWVRLYLKISRGSFLSGKFYF